MQKSDDDYDDDNEKNYYYNYCYYCSRTNVNSNDYTIGLIIVC